MLILFTLSSSQSHHEFPMSMFQRPVPKSRWVGLTQIVQGSTGRWCLSELEPLRDTSSPKCGCLAASCRITNRDSPAVPTICGPRKLPRSGSLSLWPASPPERLALPPCCRLIWQSEKYSSRAQRPHEVLILGVIVPRHQRAVFRPTRRFCSCSRCNESSFVPLSDVRRELQSSAPCPPTTILIAARRPVHGQSELL
jgi:hypothetical protein